MVRLVLVRHGRPVVSPREPPSAWPLDSNFRPDVVRLGARLALPTSTAVVASTDREALDTAEALSIATQVRPAVELREVTKPWFDDPDAHQRETHAYLNAQPLSGWEPIAAAVWRFQDALDQQLVENDVLVVTHGTVMTAWLTSIGMVADGFSFWTELGQPDAWEVDLKGKRTWRLA